jgi:hypothetical protein
MFIALLRHCVRFDARDYLQALDGPMYAVSGLFDSHVGDRILMRQELARLVYGED